MRRIERPRDDRSRLRSTLGIDSPLLLGAPPRTGYPYRNAFRLRCLEELFHRLPDRIRVPPGRWPQAHTRIRATCAASRTDRLSPAIVAGMLRTSCWISTVC